MAKAKRTRPGPKITDPPHLIAIRNRLEELGHGSLKDAAEKAKIPYDSFLRLCRYGLANDPRESTVSRLRDLGIFDLVPRKNSA